MVRVGSEAEKKCGLNLAALHPQSPPLRRLRVSFCLIPPLLLSSYYLLPSVFSPPHSHPPPVGASTVGGGDVLGTDLTIVDSEDIVDCCFNKVSANDRNYRKYRI